MKSSSIDVEDKCIASPPPAGEFDDDDDDWESGELPPIPGASTNIKHDEKIISSGEDDVVYDEDTYWKDVPQKLNNEIAPRESNGGIQRETIIDKSDNTGGGSPMLIVDLTLLSGGKIHSKFDQNSVNDPVLMREWKKKIEQHYSMYASDSNLLANRTVIPCGSSVWRGALSVLRNETKGHYFCPIFPPK